MTVLEKTVTKLQLFALKQLRYINQTEMVLPLLSKHRYF